MSTPDIPTPPSPAPQPNGSEGIDPRLAYALTHTSIGGYIAGLVDRAGRLGDLPQVHQETLFAENPGLAEVVAAATPAPAEETAVIPDPTMGQTKVRGDAPQRPRPTGPRRYGEAGQIPRSVLRQESETPAAEDFVGTTSEGSRVVISGAGIEAAQRRLHERQALEIDPLSAPLELLGQGQHAATMPRAAATPAAVPGSPAWHASRHYGHNAPAATQAAPVQESHAAEDGEPLLIDPATWLGESEPTGPFGNDEVFPHGIGRDKADQYASAIDEGIARLRAQREVLNATVHAARTDGTQTGEEGGRANEPSLPERDYQSTFDQLDALQGNQRVAFLVEQDKIMPGLFDAYAAYRNANQHHDEPGLPNAASSGGGAEAGASEPTPIKPNELTPLGEKERVTEEFARQLFALDNDESQQDAYFNVLNQLSPRQRKQYFAQRAVFQREEGEASPRTRPEMTRRRKIMYGVGGVAVAAAAVSALAAAVATRDVHHVHTVISSLPGVHPSGSAASSPAHSLVSVTPSGNHGSSASTLASSTTPSPKGTLTATPSPGAGHGGIGGNSHGSHGGNTAPQLPGRGAGHVGTQPSIDHAIQINNDFAAQHHGNTQPLWSSLHQAGFSDNQIANAIEKAKSAGQVKEVPMPGGGYFLRLTSTNSDNPDAVMNVLKGFI